MANPKAVMFFFIAFLVIGITLMGIVSGESLTIAKDKPKKNNTYTNTSEKISISNIVNMDALINVSDYNIYYFDNGTQAIRTESMYVEYYDEKDEIWVAIKDRGEVSFEPKIDEYSIVKKYSDKKTADYEVRYDQPKNKDLKITVSLNSTTKKIPMYRIKWELKGLAPATYRQYEYGYVYGEQIKIDYEDVYLSFGDIAFTEANGGDLTIYFYVGALETFVLDPSIAVGQGTEIFGTPTVSPTNRKVMRDVNGTYYASYIDTLTPAILVYMSRDFGEEWQLIKNITAPPSIYFTDMWINSTSAIQINAFTDQAGSARVHTYTSNDYFYTYNYTNASASATIEFFTSFLQKNETAIACAAVEASPDQLWMMRWDGANWAQPTGEITTLSTNEFRQCDIEDDGRGGIHIVAINISSRVSHFNSSDGGFTWTEQVIALNSSAPVGDMHDMVINDKDEIFVAYQSSAKLTIANSSNYGMNWTVRQPANQLFTNCEDNPTITADRYGTLHILATDPQYVFNSRICYGYSTDNGATWTSTLNYHGGGASDDNFRDVAFGNSKYLNFDNRSRVLRYLYTDVDSNTIYFDSINVDFYLANITQPISTGNNRSNNNLSVDINYTHENRLSATINATWYRNGTLVLSETKTASTSGITITFNLNNTFYSRNDLINVSMFAIDSQGNATLNRTVPTINISNTIPEVSNVSISPSSPTNNDDLTCNYGFTDYDNDTDGGRSYLWYKDSVQQAGQTASTLSNAQTGTGEQWICSVRVNDSREFSAYLNSSAVTITAGGGGGQPAGGGGGATTTTLAKILKSNFTYFELATDTGTRRYDLFLGEDELRVKKYSVLNYYEEPISVGISCLGEICDKVSFDKQEVTIAAKSVGTGSFVINSVGLEKGKTYFIGVKGRLSKLNKTAVPSYEVYEKNLDVFATMSSLSAVRLYFNKFISSYSIFGFAVPKAIIYLLSGFAASGLALYANKNKKPGEKATYSTLAFIIFFILASLLDEVLLGLI